MGQPRVLLSTSLVLLALPLLLAAHDATAAQMVCEESPYTEPADIGAPGQDGVAIETALSAVGDQIAFRFRVPEPATGYVYVGDQWYDLDLALWREFQAFACWRVSGVSERRERRVLQLFRPDEQILELTPGDYTLVASAPASRAFDPTRPFTIRVALGPAPCGPLDPANVPHPSYPGVLMRAEDALYQLALTVTPRERERGPFSLLTFDAFISPPYTDLFDFTWELDGAVVPDESGPTLQAPASSLPARAHVRVTARGAREYPDPDQPHIPPTLTTECTFLSGAR